MQSPGFFARGRLGLNILLLSFIGLLSLLVSFLFTKGRSASLSDPQQRILKTLTDGGISQRAAMYWLAVAMFETGDFTSNIFKLANNAFGMGVAQVRETNRSSIYEAANGRKFSAYLSLEDSVRDLMLYMDEFGYPNDWASIEVLVLFMKKCGYFEETYEYYLAGVKAKLSKLL